MPNGLRLTKDQQRAQRAYTQVNPLWNAYATARAANDSALKASAKAQAEKYKTGVRSLGANILRSGLSAAFAELMRRKNDTQLLREHLAQSDIPGLQVCNADNLFQTANGLAVDAYMLATRETLQVVMWLKRAAEALFDFDGSDHSDETEAGGPAAHA
jgi:CRISPR-associated protein Cmr5